MDIIGIICEYNPLHLGHKKQFDQIRAQYPDSAIVCIMSGNFVQRGKPAIFHKLSRAKAAILCGADLVLELPVTAALSSAEGFAAAGVRLLGSFCDRLCFGTETADETLLVNTAQALLTDEFSQHLRLQLEQGLSFPAARQAALEAMGCSGALLSQPNDILAVEYTKAILSQGASMQLLPIHRAGSYHTVEPDRSDPSASAVRLQILKGALWQAYVPEAAAQVFSDAAIHTLQAGERAMLFKLRTMPDEVFEALPYGSEGLWRKLMHAARQESTLEQLLVATKSKRYTRTRLDRMVMCAFLELTAEQLAQTPPYARVLALNDTGRQVLNKARQTGLYPNIGEHLEHPYQRIEDRCDSLYGLFCAAGPEPPQPAYRVYYHK